MASMKPPSELRQMFAREMSASLHEMAQPLAIIQSSLELAVARQTTAKEYRQLAENALQHMDSALESMQFLRQLVRLQQPASDIAEIKLSDVLSETLQQLNRIFEAAMVTPFTVAAEDETLVRISFARLKQMLFQILQCAVTHCSRGSVLQMTVQRHGERMELSVRSLPSQESATHQQQIGNEARIAVLSLAELIVNSAGGDFLATVSPFSVSMAFPAVEVDDRQSVLPFVPATMKASASL